MKWVLLNAHIYREEICGSRRSMQLAQGHKVCAHQTHVGTEA